MNDYRWYARYNVAKCIRQKAVAEYNERKNTVSAWAQERIEQNLEKICRDILQEKLSGEKKEHPCKFSMVELKGEWWDKLSTHKTFIFVKDRKARYRRPGTVSYPLHNNADAGCWFADDAPCSYLLKVRVYDMKDLLYVTGCASTTELPDVLQHWLSNSYGYRNTGNQNLDRVDPLDWVVKDPWGDMSFDTIIGIGKKYLSQVKKELGITKKG